MSKAKLMVTGLVAGFMVFGTACSSDMSARRSQPTQDSAMGGAGQMQEDSASGIYGNYTVPQEDRASTGGSGYQDTVTNPDASSTSNSKSMPKSDIRDQDPMRDPGTGGSGYESDSDMFKDHQELGGGSRFPSDSTVPQNL